MWASALNWRRAWSVGAAVDAASGCSRSDISSWNVASSTGRSLTPSQVAPGATLFCTRAAEVMICVSESGPPEMDTGMPRGSWVSCVTASQSIFSLRAASSFWMRSARSFLSNFTCAFFQSRVSSSSTSKAWM